MGEETDFEDPLDLFLEDPPVDKSEKSDEEAEKGFILNSFCGHFPDQFDKITGPGQFVNILPQTLERTDQVTMTQPDEVRSLFFEKSCVDVRADFQPGPKAFPRPLGPLGKTFDFAELISIKGDDLVRLAVRQSMED
jgi:hypothetical protein